MTDEQLLALAEADGMSDRLCGASGPDGDSCSRTPGHTDPGEPVLQHVGWDTDQFQAWPVGWAPPEQRIRRIVSPDFARDVEGSPEFQRGFQACLVLVRSVLG